MTDSCPLCRKENFESKLELTESMILICPKCSHGFAVASNGHRKIYQTGFRI